MSDVPTREQLDHQFEYSLAWARKTFDKEGVIAPALHAFDEKMKLRLSLTCAGDKVMYIPQLTEGDIGVVPRSFRDHQQLIKEWFGKKNIIGAVVVNEIWMYPDDDHDRATRAYLAGDGGLPSEHPRREDGLFIGCLCPMAGYSRVGQWRFVRRPHRKPVIADTAFVTAGESNENENMSHFTSWLEDCLPNPDDAAVRAARDTL